MNSYRLIAFICIFSFFTACKKDNGSSSTPSQSRLISYTETINPRTVFTTSTTYNLAYDDNNRLLSLTNSQDAGNKFMFSYVQGGFNFDIYSANTLVIHQNVFMNGDKMDSTIQYNNEGDTTAEKYVYWGNQLKYLTEYNVSSAGSQVVNVTEYLYDLNDALIREQDYFSSTSYSYSAIEMNNFNLYPVYVNRSIQLPSQVTYSNGGQDIVSNHTYTFDAQHRLVMDRIETSGPVVEKTFKYE